MEANPQAPQVVTRPLGWSLPVEIATRNVFPVVLTALIAVSLSLLSPGLLVADSWMTLVSGREIVQHGLPHHDPLTALSLGKQWTDQQWLSQLAWYGIDRASGLAGVSLVATLVVVVTFASAMTAARIFGATARSTFLVGLVAIFAGPWGWQVRAQSLALPLFVWTLWLAGNHVRRPSRRIFAAFPLLIVWANVHGSVLLGAIVVSLALVIAGAKERSPRALPVAVGLGALSWLCAVVTPYGTDIIPYYRLLLINPPFGKLVVEWQRTTPSGLTAVFFFLMAVTVALALWQRKRLVVFDTLVLAITLVGALQAIRGIVWFTLAVTMLLPRLLDGAIRRPDVVQMPRANAVLAFVSVAAAAGVLVFVAAKPRSWFEHKWPDGAVRAVTDAGPTARVFASDRHADWLLWRIPSLRGRLAYDIRFELYTKRQIVALGRFSYHEGNSWARIADGYRVIVVDEESSAGSPSKALLREPGTRVLYRDDGVSVLLR
jgi:hypothetical protein